MGYRPKRVRRDRVGGERVDVRSQRPRVKTTRRIWATVNPDNGSLQLIQYVMPNELFGLFAWRETRSPLVQCRKDGFHI